MGKSVFLIGAAFVFFLAGHAQEWEEYHRNDQSPAELRQQIQQAKEDSDKVSSLLALCEDLFYYEQGMDSALRYAREARTFSAKSLDKTGFNDAVYNECRIRMLNKQFREAAALLKIVTPDQQVRLFIAMGQYFLYLPGQLQDDLDSAHAYYSRAMDLACSIGSDKCKVESRLALARYDMVSGNTNKGRERFLAIVDRFHRAGQPGSEADALNYYFWSMPDTDSTVRESVATAERALGIYRKLKDTIEQANMLMGIGWRLMWHSEFRGAKSSFLSALRLLQAARIRKVHEPYMVLATSSMATGDLNEALSYLLKAEVVIQAMEVPQQPLLGLFRGLIYADLQQDEKSLSYLIEAGKNMVYWKYFICRKIAEAYIRLGNPAEGLLYANRLERSDAPVRLTDKESLAATKGDCYMALNDPRLAEDSYKLMIRLDEQAQKKRSREIKSFDFSLSGSEAYFRMANFLVSQKQYARAKTFLAKAFVAGSFPGINYHTANLVRKMNLLQFKVDSALGDYVSAIRYYERFTALNDSLFNAEKTRQLQQLQVANETQKKESEIRLKDHEIRVLTQTDMLRQMNLKKSYWIRNLILSTTLVVVVLAGFLYWQYRLLRRANAKLRHLVKEKEWLVKEMHHRVKNNLQTVISLLESHAAYLEDDALKAIDISRQRIYTMSLIHQKLYQGDDIENVDMSIYIPDLVEYLKEGIESNNIHISLFIEPVLVETSRAISLALMINEALTNSIKHAFPDGRQGEIIISLKEDDRHVFLEVSDNGVGFDKTVQLVSEGSLGLNLMKGLAKELKGRITIGEDKGVCISVRFEKREGGFTGNSSDNLFIPVIMPN